MNKSHKVQFGDLRFKTYKAAESYVRNLLCQIGICKSVKQKKDGVSLYQKLFDISSNHPQSLNKLANISDFSIQQNKRNPKALELYIIKNDGSRLDISWIHCAKGKPKTIRSELLSALRTSINLQILVFKKTHDTSSCSLCGTSTLKSLHIDHDVQFIQLVADFLDTQSCCPIIFDDDEDFPDRRYFFPQHSKFQQDWISFHHRNAILRPLCAKCNLSRHKITNLL